MMRVRVIEQRLSNLINPSKISQMELWILFHFNSHIKLIKEIDREAEPNEKNNIGITEFS